MYNIIRTSNRQYCIGIWNGLGTLSALCRLDRLDFIVMTLLLKRYTGSVEKVPRLIILNTKKDSCINFII